MKKSIRALTMVVAIAGLSTAALADGHGGGPTAEEQTSAEQVQICDAGLQGCQGGDTGQCVAALKTCVGEKRQQAMKLMEAS